MIGIYIAILVGISVEGVFLRRILLLADCYFTKYHIDCFEDRYNYLHGCFKALSYYSESNSDDRLFKL